MKEKILLTILMILLVIIGIITYIKVSFEKEQIQTTPQNIKKPELTSLKEVEFCKDKDTCPIPVENMFGELTFDYDDKSIQKWIKKINQESEKYYQESINSTTNNEECANVKDIYNYQFIYRTYYTNYIGDKYISLSTKRTKYDLCSNTNKDLPIQTFLYNQKTKKQITQEELEKELNLTEEQIKEAIQKNMTELNQITTKEFDYSNYNLYYNLNGHLLAEYYLPEKDNYYSATIRY